MKNIGKSTIALFLAIILTSCNSFSSPSMINPTDVMETAMSIVETEVIKTQAAIPTITSLPPTESPSPTPINTAFFTPIPTSTITPTIQPKTAQPKTDILTSENIIFLVGEDSAGEKIYGFPPNPFWMFTAQPDEIATFHFTMKLQTIHFINNVLTPTPTVQPTIGWRVLFYRYRTDETYANQPVVETSLETSVKIDKYTDPTTELTKIMTTLTSDVKMKDLQRKFGDCSAFTFQVMDEQGNMQQQGFFSINPHHLPFYEGGIKGDIKNGVTIGYPYSLNENETEFFHQGKFITILESQGGFYRLSYQLNFFNASGVSARIEQEKLASKLSIKIFPYREDGKYSIYDSHPAIGTLHSGVGLFEVDLPIDYLRENVNGKNKYYLQIMDDKGKIIRDEYFLFIPYTP